MSINKYNLDDKILYRKDKKYRLQIYTINKLLDNNRFEIKNNYDDVIEINLKKSNIDIKKYISYDECKEIYCEILNKKDLIFTFKCNYCDIIHKHNKLGKQDCKCNCCYSPYYKNGYILKLNIPTPIQLYINIDDVVKLIFASHLLSKITLSHV